MGSSSHNENCEILEDVVEDLEYLTTDIDAPDTNDLLWWMQRHVVGVGERFGCPLRKLTRVVACYYDSHDPHD